MRQQAQAHSEHATEVTCHDNDIDNKDEGPPHLNNFPLARNTSVS